MKFGKVISSRGFNPGALKRQAEPHGAGTKVPATDFFRRGDGFSAAQLISALSVVGITGLTAYFGLLDVGQPRSGETVVVSGAAGENPERALYCETLSPFVSHHLRIDHVYVFPFLSGLDRSGGNYHGVALNGQVEDHVEEFARPQAVMPLSAAR